MKKILLYIGIALVAIGCTKDEITEKTPTSGEINFSAGVTTRVGSGDDDCTWASGDQISIYTDQTGEDNMLFIISNTSTGAMTADEDMPELYPLTSGKRTYYAYHPYIANDASERFTTSVDDKTITVSTSNYATPLLWATTTTNDTNVELQFTHMLPKVTFNLTAGGLDVTTLDGATVWIEGATSKATLEVKTGEFTDPSTDKIDLTLDDNDSITAYLLPTAEVSDKVKLWIYVGSNTYLKTLTTESWESGSSYEYDIIVGEQLAITNDGNGNYSVYTAAGLFEFANLVNSGNTSFNCTLMNDIDLSSVCYEGGDNWTPIGTYDLTNSANSVPYTGTFDGGGYLVSGLYINTDSNFQGLFGYVYGGTIKNVGVDGSVTGGTYVGGVAGWSLYSSSVTSCYNTGDVTATGSRAWVGGVIGISEFYSSVTSCYNTGDVTATGAEARVGGVMGGSDSFSSTTSCYNTGDVTSEGSYTYVGGVVGYSSSSVTSCYSCGSVSSASDTNLGGVVGSNWENTVSYCYYDTDTVDNDDNNESTFTPQGAVNGSNDDTNYCGLETSLMQGGATTSGTLLYYFDAAGYSQYWTADTENINNGYPILTTLQE